MTDLKWNAWFIVSCIWTLIHLFIMMVVPNNQIVALGNNFMYMFGFILSFINLGLCIYEGSKPSEAN